MEAEDWSEHVGDSVGPSAIAASITSLTIRQALVRDDCHSGLARRSSAGAVKLAEAVKHVGGLIRGCLGRRSASVDAPAAFLGVGSIRHPGNFLCDKGCYVV